MRLESKTELLPDRLWPAALACGSEIKESTRQSPKCSQISFALFKNHNKNSALSYHIQSGEYLSPLSGVYLIVFTSCSVILPPYV
jgi:hypothetical protein